MSYRQGCARDTARRSHGVVVDGLDVVSVGVENKRPVIAI